MSPGGPGRLERAIAEIDGVARDLGLDGFPVRFEICPADVLYTIGAYGMPTRFQHWSRGKAFWRMKTEYDYNLSRLYELVINSDPCYAFLLEGNSLVQQKLVAAHVYGHSDFFRHNFRFAGTSRFMLETMAASAERIRSYEFRYGKDLVETYLDAALAIEEHIDPYARPDGPAPAARSGGRHAPEDDVPYADLLTLGEPAPEPPPPAPKRLPERPEKDLLRFIAEHARDLDDWQRDLVGIVRGEMLYFWPQVETKLCNEGWATWAHTRIMRRLDLSDAEAVEYAKLHSGILQRGRYRLNPYLLGFKLLEDIERRYGTDHLWEVRETQTDVSLVRNYLTRELVAELDLYLYRKVGDQWQVSATAWEQVRDGIVRSLTNGGHPVIVVEDGDYNRAGELYLRHCFDGWELDATYTERTLPSVYRLWGRPVHLETVVGDKVTVFSHDGERVTRKVRGPAQRRVRA